MPRGDGQFLHQLAAFDLRQGADALDDVLVDRVVVIDVELHHRDDGFEFRDEGRQHAQLVHPAQAAFGVAVLQQQIEEDALRFGVARASRRRSGRDCAAIRRITLGCSR